jgi:hypothetical protein
MFSTAPPSQDPPAAAAMRPMWQCPACGRRYANRNQFHSCTTLTVQDHLREKTLRAVELYVALEAAVQECGPIRVHATKSRIAFVTRMQFARATLRKKFIVASLILPHRVENPRFRRIDRHGPHSFGHHLRIHSVDEIDEELKGWLCEAYRVGQQAYQPRYRQS